MLLEITYARLLPCCPGAVVPAPLPLLWAIGVTVGFAVLAYLIRGVTLSGAVAGAVVAFALLYCGGLGVFAALLMVFVLTWLGTRAGYGRKHQMGIAESRRGRNAGQVLANLSVAALCGLIMRTAGGVSTVALTSCMAALAEAAADTLSSECGEAWSERAYLITGLRAVPPGTNGAVSVPGTLAGAVAAALIGTTAAATGVLPLAPAMVGAGAGFAGSLFDSLLGATLERRGWMGNNAVNFLSTAAAAILAGIVSALA